jgi:hypothetical protein
MAKYWSQNQFLAPQNTLYIMKNLIYYQILYSQWPGLLAVRSQEINIKSNDTDFQDILASQFHKSKILLGPGNLRIIMLPSMTIIV